MIAGDGYAGVEWQYYLWANVGNPTSIHQWLS